MIKRIAPIGMLVAAACGGGGDGGGTGPSGNPSDISSMAVGEVRTLNPVDITNGITLPAASGDRDYVIIVGNTSTVHDVPANYTVQADRSPTTTFGIEVAADMAARTSRQISAVTLARTRQQTVHNKVRAFERSGLTLHSSNRTVPSSRFSIRRSVQVVASPVPNVGDLINVKVPDASTDDLCANFIPTQARVASVSRRAIIAVDTLDGPPSTLFSQTDFDQITQEFDNITYPTDSSYFNKPTDLDNNSHIVLLYSGQVNKLTPPNSDSFVGGFFFAGDIFPSTDQGDGPGSFCPESNEGEIFYLLSPDPTGRFGNVRSTSSVRQGTRGTIAHEFQHMINAGNRYLAPCPPTCSLEATWLDEALAHFAEDAVGRVVRGFGDLETLTFNDVLPCAPCSQADDFDAFFLQNFSRLTYWMGSPDKYAPFMKMADTSLAVRGAAWAIVRYAADNYSGGEPRKLTRTLAAGPDTGVKNFAAATKAPIDTLVKGWLVSMYADHLGIPNLDPKYQYRAYNFRSIMPPVARALLDQQTATYPLRIQSVGTGSDNFTGTNHSGSGTYYRLNVSSGAGAKTVKIVDASGNNASFPGEHVYVLRVQ